jgi:hypothetical protein
MNATATPRVRVEGNASGLGPLPSVGRRQRLFETLAGNCDRRGLHDAAA